MKRGILYEKTITNYRMHRSITGNAGRMCWYAIELKYQRRKQSNSFDKEHLGYSRGVFISNTYERHPLSGWRMSLFQSKHILYIYIILINSILTHSP